MSESNYSTEAFFEQKGLMETEAFEREEARVRAMRDKVYGRRTSDNNWDACREYWMDPENVRWLEQRC